MNERINMNTQSNSGRETTEEESGMNSDRRDFLKLAGTVAVGVAAASWAIPAAAQSGERKE